MPRGKHIGGLLAHLQMPCRCSKALGHDSVVTVPLPKLDIAQHICTERQVPNRRLWQQWRRRRILRCLRKGSRRLLPSRRSSSSRAGGSSQASSLCTVPQSRPKNKGRLCLRQRAAPGVLLWRLQQQQQQQPQRKADHQHCLTSMQRQTPLPALQRIHQTPSSLKRPDR